MEHTDHVRSVQTYQFLPILIQHQQVHHQGGVTALVVDYKLIVKRAVEVLASSLIIVHNHPSGVAAPSPEDISITKRIGDAAALFDIGLVDHIIIADGSSYSFRQYGLIK